MTRLCSVWKFLSVVASLGYPDRSSSSMHSLFLLNSTRMKSLPLFFNIISIHLDALSPSLFQFAYPFKTGVFILVPEVLIYCIYDTFIVSEIPTRDKRYLEISSLLLFWSLVNILGTHLAKTLTFPRCQLGLTELPQNLCSLHWLYLASFASVTHDQTEQSQYFHLWLPLWDAQTVHLQRSPSPS